MTVVVDASALVAALTNSGPEGTWAEVELTSQALAAPEVLMAEASNTLRSLERTGELSTPEATTVHGIMTSTNVELYTFAPFSDRVWELRHNLTCYDAWYVALAEMLDCPLITLDRRLSRAAGPTCEFVTPTYPV